MSRHGFRRISACAAAAGLVFVGFSGIALAADSEIWGDGGQVCVPAAGADCAGVSHKWEAEHHADLSGINLKRARLHGADFQGADLTDANLNGVVLKHADLDGADLAGSSVRRAKLHFASLDGVNADGANFIGANLAHVYLSGASLRGADFRRARFDNAEVSNSDFSSVTSKARVASRNDVFDKSNMQESRWVSTRVKGSDFTGANMAGSFFKDSTFDDVNFTNANLSGSTFEGDNYFFAGTNFYRANLSNSVISQATFRSMNGNVGGINLDGIRLTGDTGNFSSVPSPVVYRVVNKTSAGNIVINMTTGNWRRTTNDYGLGPGESSYFWVTDSDGGKSGAALTGWVDGLAIDTYLGSAFTNNLLTWNGQEVSFNSGSKDTASTQFTSGSRSYKIDVQYLVEEKRYRVDLIIGDN